MHKIGQYEVSDDQFEKFNKASKEEIGELLVASATVVVEQAAEIEDLQEELEITEEINDDLRADLELKDKTIRSLVEVCKHLASRATA